MKLISASNGANKVSVTKSFTGGKDVFKVGKLKCEMPKDAARTRLTHEEEKMTFGRMLLLVLLAITVFGLILAIPLYFAFKKKRATLAVKTHDNITFVISAGSNREAKMLKKYSDIGFEF